MSWRAWTIELAELSRGSGRGFTVGLLKELPKRGRGPNGKRPHRRKTRMWRCVRQSNGRSIVAHTAPIECHLINFWVTQCQTAYCADVFLCLFFLAERPCLVIFQLQACLGPLGGTRHRAVLGNWLWKNSVLILLLLLRPWRHFPPHSSTQNGSNWFRYSTLRSWSMFSHNRFLQPKKWLGCYV